MAKPNYQFEKRQKELEKKKKQEQKRLRKLGAHQPADERVASADLSGTPPESSGDAPAG